MNKLSIEWKLESYLRRNAADVNKSQNFEILNIVM